MLEPLLRLAGVYDEAEVVRKWDLPDNLTADYAVLDSGRKVLCIIEAKLNLGKRGNWQTNPHVKQAREYAEMCNAPRFRCDGPRSDRLFSDAGRASLSGAGPSDSGRKWVVRLASPYSE
jgi:hypothetical protein